MASSKQIPPNLKSVQPYIKIAEEHDKRNPTVSYWCRLYAVQSALKINDKSPESQSFLIGLMTWLENYKKLRVDDETITNEVVAQAHIENHALKLFLWADGEDRAGQFNKNVVKAFYTAGFIFDIVNTFGEPSEEVVHQRKYAKWKSTYIHNCLKNGITPVAGPMAMEGEEDEDLSVPSFPPDSSSSGMPPQAPYPVGGLFNIPGAAPDSQNLPVPGSHAPPSTPNGAGNLPAMTSAMDLNDQDRCESDSVLKPEVYQKAQKYCKWAGSALQYEDAPTAIDNLQKALRLLTTGQE